MGIISLIVLSLAAGIVGVIALLGAPALIVLAAFSIMAWAGIQFRLWEHLPLPNKPVAAPRRSKTLPSSTRSPFVVLLGMGVLAGGFLLEDSVGATVRWGGIVLGMVIALVLWRYLRQRFTVDGRLVLREMAGRRSRVASTLLGLSVGIAGLSLVALTTSAVSHLLEIRLEENAEGNLLVVDPGANRRDDVRSALQNADGVTNFSQFITYQAILLEVNGEPIELRQRRIEEQNDPHENSNFERVEQGAAMILSVRESVADIPDYEMKAGRTLQAGDEGTHRIMVRESFFVEEMGIHNGDRLLYLFENGPGEQDDILIRLTVVGVIARESEQIGLGDQFLVPPETLPDTITPLNMLTVALIDDSDPAYMDNVLVELSDVQGVIAVELSVLTQLIENLLDQLKAIPTLVAWLALVAGTAIIANTVALATQERRRQIGVMKAIGLKGHRVLNMLMVENGLIGLMAGLIGVGVGLLTTVILVLATQNPDELRNTLEFATIGWLILLSISVSIVAAAFSAWSAAAEKPMNVLRYE
jgi:ABC-type antimicrobial peptide transport system permease subunit